jgi:phosphocarrier protein
VRAVSETSRKVTIVNALGLHARSAARIAELARSAESSVSICKGDACADATDIFDVLSLCCPEGTELTVHVADAGDTAVLAAICDLIAGGFGESVRDE